MKIAVIGPGSMGLLYGAKLSVCADVVLVGNNAEHIEEINKNSVAIKRDGKETKYNVRAVLNGEEKENADLIILFTKAYLTKDALEQNKDLIGSDTILLSLQNGVGHEEVLAEFTSDKNILIGTTGQGSYRENAYTIVNSGLGDTAIGAVSDEFEGIDKIKDIFEKSDFPCTVSDNIRHMIWNKLMINASSSVLSGVLGVNQGYVAENADAWEICRDLIKEICAAAAGEGYPFDEDEQTERIANHLKNAPGGYTSIYADLKCGRKTEVDYISGAVVRAAQKQGKTVPAQTMMVRMVHAMEGAGR